MSIPDPLPAGDLPPGIHVATVDEVVRRFGSSSTRRINLAARLRRIHRVASETGHLARFVVFGSFVTTKEEPNDIDVFMIMEDGFDTGALVGEAGLLFDHAAADAFFGASVFWLRRMSALDGEQAAVEYWQIKRDRGLRGIVEIVEDPK